MNADCRIIPSHHVTSVLAEEGISERTMQVKKSLQFSPNKLHKVANKWIGYDGINPLSRVMLKNVTRVPTRKKLKTIHQTTTAEKLHSVHKNNHGHDDHSRHEEGNHLKIEHQANHLQDPHHAHEVHHGHGEEHGKKMSNYCANIFGIIGHIFGAIIDYLLKLLFILMIFGPTRTAIITFVVTWGINIFADIKLPIGLIIIVAFVCHLIFAGASRLARSNGEHNAGGHHHGHDDHAHDGHSGHGHH